MSAEPFLLELEVRAFLPWERASELLAHASSAFVRRGTMAGPHDLVLVVDRTNPEGLLGDPASPHRTNRRPGPFELPMADVLRHATELPSTFLTPLRRVTIVEINDTALTPEDTARLDAYVSPKKGTTLVAAVYVDTAGKTVHTNDGASPRVTGLVHAEDPAEWARRAYGAARVVGAPNVGVENGVALFGARAVAAVTFFFSPIGGAALLAWNLYRTRRAALGVALLAITAAALIVVVLLPVPGAGGPGIAMGLNVAGLVIFLKLTVDLFGEPLRKAGVGLAILLGLGSVGVAFGGGITAAVAWEAVNTNETAASNGAVISYDRGTSATHARRVGEALVERRVLGGPKSGVRIRREGATHSLTFAFGDEHVLDAATKEFYRGLARELSSDPFGGAPVRIVFEGPTGTRFDEVTSR